MRQFSPFQEVTEIPVLFLAQACSVPAQTTSRGGSDRLSRSRQQPGAGAQCKHCPSPRNPCMEKGHCPDIVSFFSVMFGAVGRAALNTLTAVERWSKMWRAINSSLGEGLAQHLEGLGWEGEPPSLGEGDLVGMSVQDTQPLAPAASSPQVLPRNWDPSVAGAHRASDHQNSWSPHLQESFWRRERGGKAGITSPSRKYLPAKGRSQHEMQK